MPQIRGRLPGSERLFGAAVWAAYGLVELLLAGAGAHRSFAAMFVLPGDRRYAIFLLVLYPLVGALLGRFAVVGLAAAFAANAVALMSGRLVVVAVLSAAVAAALFRGSPWTASLLLLLPLWAARVYGVDVTVWKKALLAAGALLAVMLFGLVAMKRRWSLKPGVALVTFTLFMLASTLGEPPQPRNRPADAPPPRVASPNIVLIVMDTVGARHLSVYGYARNTTPELARLAKTATLYTRAYAPSNMTLPSHASLFTGLYGSEHTAHYDEGWIAGRPLPAEALTIAELLSARGYATASIVANGYLSEAFGLDQGFDHLDARAPELPYGLAPEYYLRSGIAAVAARVVDPGRDARRHSRGGEEISDRALEYLDRAAGRRRPFFLFLNYLDAHHPYLPPAPYDRMFPGLDETQPDDLVNRLVNARGMTARQRAHLVSQYDGSITYLDQQIARVLDGLRQRGVYDETLIVIVSDHGEAFGEHGVVTHGVTNYDTETHVPLIVKQPGQTAGVVVTDPVSVLEVWPLLSSIPRPPFPVITEAFPMRGPAATSPGRRSGTAKVAGTLKTIVNVDGEVETYDWIADPGETRNLAPNAESRRMAEELSTWRRQLRGVAPAETPRAVDPETLRRLRALGYVR